MMTARTLDAEVSSQKSRFHAVRSASNSLEAALSAEHQMIHSCPDAGPIKWHMAHTTWFFETFVLRPFVPDYEPRCDSRPSLEEITAFRAHVDRGMERF